MNEVPLHAACGICPRQSHLPPRADSYNNTELTFHNLALMKLTRVHCRHTNNPEPLVPLHHVWVLPVWGHQKTEARPGPLVFPSVIQRHGRNRIRVDSCLCALRFVSVLQGEICKRDRHRKPAVRDLQLAWNEYRYRDDICNNTLLCRPASETRCCLQASCHAGLIRGLTWVM